jgi:hypothetical protein
MPTANPRRFRLTVSVAAQEVYTSSWRILLSTAGSNMVI